MNQRGGVTLTKFSFNFRRERDLSVTSCYMSYLVRSFSSVYTQMAAKVGHLNELAVAVCAGVRLLARVQAHVCFQVVITRKPDISYTQL